MPTSPVVVGGAPVEFTVTYTNPSHQDLIAFPNLFIPNSAANPNGAAPLKLEVQDAQGVWHTAAQLGSGSSAPTTWAMVYPGPQGDPWDNSWLYVPAGDVASIHVRLTAGPTTPTGVTYAVSDFTGSLLDSSGTPVSVASGMWGATLNFAAATASPQAGGSPTSGGSTAATGPYGSNGSNGSNAKPGSNPAVPASVLSKVTTPQVTAPAPAVIAAAKAASPAHPAGDLPAPSHSAGPSLAFTGGGSDSLPIALTGAAVIAAGVATLVMVRRRKGSHAA
ncbi:hypothetical protein ACFZB9_12290 [Kitasatospora sp. NPDC008050]|uniref:hypothetical protein n=1 Tax=Kitasatospora sp. NPDC008050 TaxID=3364021 RepID=UPI0036E2E39A